MTITRMVETARAGEQGRHLAGRSAGAGKAIESQITDSVGRVARGSTRVDRVGRAITLMDGAALQNSAPVEQSAHAA